MADYTYKALGPLTPGSERAALGLQIDEFGRAEPVVLVWVPDYAAKDSDLRSRVILENERATVLEHPNIVRVYGLEHIEDKHARVVEFSDGEPLRKIILAAGGKLRPELATRIVVDVCTGVHFAHEAGNEDGSPMLHGDIRPETVMVGFTGTAKISGYGALVLAPKEFEGQRRLHVAPEQVIGGREAMNRQTDVYLLGLLLHECLTGTVPHADAADFEQAVLTAPLQFLSPSDIPPELSQILDRALSKKAAQRFETPLALKAALEQAWPVATHEQLAEELSKLIPETDEVRQARRRQIDSGIAALARQQWKTRVPTGATPAKGVGSASPLPPGATPGKGVGTASPIPPGATPGKGVGPASPQPPSPPPEPPPIATVTTTPPQKKRAPLYEDEVSQVSVVRPEPMKRGPIIIGGVVLIATGLLIFLLTSMGSKGPTASEQLLTAAVDAGAPVVAVPVVVDAGAQLAVVDAGAPTIVAAPVDAGSAAVAAKDPEDDESETEGDGPPGLDIETSDGVTILLDDKEIGVGSAKVRTTPGKHVLKLVGKDGAQLRKAIWIQDKGTRKMRVPLGGGDNGSSSNSGGRGYVTIDAPEGSLVKIDGKSIGYAPIRGQVPVSAGSHEIEVMVGKAKWEENFKLKDQQKIHFNVGREHR